MAARAKYCPECGWLHYTERPRVTCAKCGYTFSSGLGDIIAATLDPIGGAWFKRTWAKKTGKNCGCESRQKQLNKIGDRFRNWSKNR